MSKDDNSLRDRLNVSVPKAPRTAQEVRDRKRAAADHRKDADGDQTAPVTPPAEGTFEPEGRPCGPLIPPYRFRPSTPKEPMSPESATFNLSEVVPDNDEVQNFLEARQNLLTRTLEEASGRQYTGGNSEKLVSVTVDGNGRILHLYVSPHLLEREQSKRISLLIMSAISQARSSAARDWMAAISADIEEG